MPDNLETYWKDTGFDLERLWTADKYEPGLSSPEILSFPADQPGLSSPEGLSSPAHESDMSSYVADELPLPQDSHQDKPSSGVLVTAEPYEWSSSAGPVTPSLQPLFRDE